MADITALELPGTPDEAPLITAAISAGGALLTLVLPEPAG
jgi:hypothetical protein